MFSGAFSHHVVSPSSLTAENVQHQINNSTPIWLGEFMSAILSAMDQRTAASNTEMHRFVASAISPIQTDMKALHAQVVVSQNRLECWTEKLAYSLDVEGKKTFELGCDLTKMAARVAAMERAGHCASRPLPQAIG
jgi:hypothetical protein